jgi:hypothetical protein
MIFYRFDVATGAADAACGGGDGSLRIEFPGGDSSAAFDVAARSGEIVLAGCIVDDYACTAPALAYLNGSDCSVIRTVVVPVPGATSGAFTGVVYDGTKAVAAGNATVGGKEQFLLARLTTGGLALDGSFDADGIVLTDWPAAAASGANDIAVHAGKFVAVGYTDYGPGASNIAMARYNNNGSLDGLCWPGGKNEAIITGHNASGISVATDANNIVISGFAYTSSSPSNQDGVMVRYKGNCSPDLTFDNDAIRVIDHLSADHLGNLASPFSNPITTGYTWGD